MSTSPRGYHHGDLRAALLDAAVSSLEAGEPFSMRAVARRAGVSPAAPYRHFADRQALESAVAVEGFTDLRTELVAAGASSERSSSAGAQSKSVQTEGTQTAGIPSAGTSSEGSPSEGIPSKGSPPEGASSAVDVITSLGVAYVRFALRRPAVFRLMFGNECDPTDSERVRASGELQAVLDEVVGRLLPGADRPALSTALWSLAHGLAFLHLDGKFRPEPEHEVVDRIRSSVAAVFDLRSLTGDPS